MKKIKKQKVLSFHESESRLQTAAEQSRFLKGMPMVCLAAGFLTFLVYLPVLRNGFINLDDEFYVLNDLITSVDLRNIGRAFLDLQLYWQPLTWISLSVDYSLWGLNPTGYHLTSILLHAFNTGLVSWFSLKLVQKAWKASYGVGPDRIVLLTAGGIAGLLFGIHPLHVESVAWVASRKDLVYSAFYLLSLIFYLRHAESAAVSGVQRTIWGGRNYYISLAFFGGALCSKPMAVTLPAVLLILDWYPLRRPGSLKNIAGLFYEKIPFFILSAAVSILTVVATRRVAALVKYDEVVDYSFGTRVLAAFQGLAHYLWKLILPLNLFPYYSSARDGAASVMTYFPAVFLVLFITVVCLYLAKRGQPWWLAVWCYYVISLFPVLGFFRMGDQHMADRFVYLSAFGPFLLAGTGAALFLNHRTGKTAALPKRILAVLSVFVLTVCIFITVRQIGYWRDSATLWTYVIENNQLRFPKVYFSRGDAFQQSGRLDEAVEDYNTAIRLDPKLLTAYLNRGSILLSKGEFDSAFKDFNNVLEIVPDSAEAHTNRGTAYLKTDQFDRAIEDYTAAIKAEPDYRAAFMNRSAAYQAKGETDLAIADYSSLLALSSIPADYAANVHMLRGDLYMKKFAVEKAVSDYQKACDMGNRTGCSRAMFPFQMK